MVRRKQPDPREGRRPTDVIEDVVAWILTSAGSFLLVVTIFVGLVAHGDAVERGRLERATRTPVEAVLVTDAPVIEGGKGSAPGVVRVDAHWAAPDGTAHTGRVPAAAGAPAGSVVTVWIDGDGRVTTPPVDEAGAVVIGGVTAGGLLVAGGALLALCWTAVRFVTGRCNARRWEREWARVEPEWSRNRR